MKTTPLAQSPPSTCSARLCRVRRGSVQIKIAGEVQIYDSRAFERRENQIIMLKPDLSVWTEKGGKYLGVAYRVRPVPIDTVEQPAPTKNDEI